MTYPPEISEVISEVILTRIIADDVMRDLRVVRNEVIV
jgi:hypothetical protein